MVWIQFLGLNCIILRFMHIFLRLCSVLAFSSFNARFICVEQKFEEKSKRFEAKPSQESSKASPISPNQMIQGKNPQTKTMHQNATERENGTPPASRGGCHGQPVVASMVAVPLPLPNCSGFLRPFVFPRQYSSVCAVFCL